MVDPHLLSSRELFSGEGWQIALEEATLPDGRRKKMARVSQYDRVHILALPTSETVLLLHEYRPFYGANVWMLPTGKVDKEKDHRSAALRELREETGCSADSLTYYFSANYFEGLKLQAHVYIARDLRDDPLPKDATEMMSVHELKVEDAMERVLRDPNTHAMSALALLRYVRDAGK